MNIEPFILCYNEEKMVRHTLNHYLTFCNKITIYDNNSTDLTLDILKKEYPQVNVISYNSENQLNDQKYLEIKNNCWKQSTADFVIVCDMDELLYHKHLYHILKQIKREQIAVPNVDGYNMISDFFPDNCQIPITEQIKTGWPAQSFNKNIIFNPQWLKEINYGPGAHTCNPVPKGKLRLKIPPKNTYLQLLHYKYLSREYVIQRHQQYAKRLSTFNKTNGYGKEYTYSEEFVNKGFDEAKQFVKTVI